MTRPRSTRPARERVSTERILAASILAEVESGRRLDVAWEASGASAQPGRAWIRNLVYGTVRLRGRIDHILSRAAGRDPRELDPEVRGILRLGVYQILEMDGVPDYAAVFESVEQVKGTRRRAAAGLVNAVLRQVVRLGPGEGSFPDPEVDLEGYLTMWGSHPGWMVRRWIRSFGPEAARALVEANNREPGIFLRPVGVDPGDAARALEAAGLASAASRCGCSIRLRRGADPGAALAAVPAVIQDPAASLVVEYASPAPGSWVADLCAAPGGKALALSDRAGGVVAADLSPRRVARLVEARRRLGARVWPVVADARFPPLREVPMVFVDAPCSGTGTLRRHPDGRWRVREADIQLLAGVQRSIMDGAASVVPRGGLLVYATCALEPEENWGQVESFLARHPDFRVEAGAAPERWVDPNGCLMVMPGGSGFDGAFAARLRRVSG